MAGQPTAGKRGEAFQFYAIFATTPAEELKRDRRVCRVFEANRISNPRLVRLEDSANPTRSFENLHRFDRHQGVDLLTRGAGDPFAGTVGVR